MNEPVCREAGRTVDDSVCRRGGAAIDVDDDDLAVGGDQHRHDVNLTAPNDLVSVR
jgi:hypothetical protein